MKTWRTLTRVRARPRSRLLQHLSVTSSYCQMEGGGLPVSPVSLADVTFRLMEHGSGLELLVFAVAWICYEARTSKTHSEDVALALSYSLYWVVVAQMHFPTFLHSVQEKEWLIFECQNRHLFQIPISNYFDYGVAKLHKN